MRAADCLSAVRGTGIACEMLRRPPKFPSIWRFSSPRRAPGSNPIASPCCIRTGAWIISPTRAGADRSVKCCRISRCRSSTRTPTCARSAAMRRYSRALTGWKSRSRIFRPNTLPRRRRPRCTCSLRARLGSSGDRHLVGQFAATAQKAAAENRLSSIVDAFASAADAALAEIAAQAGENLARVSEAR